MSTIEVVDDGEVSGEPAPEGVNDRLALRASRLKTLEMYDAIVACSLLCFWVFCERRLKTCVCAECVFLGVLGA